MVPIVIAGKREQVHTIITSKPCPPPTDIRVLVDLIIQNVTILRLNVSTELVSDPANVTRFVAIHTFDVPSDIDEESGLATIRFEFVEPSGWSIEPLVFPVVPVITGEKLILLACV